MLSAISRPNLPPCARPQACAPPVVVRQVIAVTAGHCRLRAALWSPFFFLRGEAGSLCLEPFEGLRFVDHEARVATRPDIVEFVLDGDLERDLASLHRCDAHRDLGRHAHEGRGEMLDRDFHAHRILSRIGVLENELAAGMLDVEDHGGSCIGARFISHEPNGSFTAYFNAIGPGYIWTQARLHDVFSIPAV